MALHCSLLIRCSTLVPTEEFNGRFPPPPCRLIPVAVAHESGGRHTALSIAPALRRPTMKARASKAAELVFGDGPEDSRRKWSPGNRVRNDSSDDDEEGDSNDDDAPLLMSDEEREEMRRKIREVLDANPNVEEETDPEQRRIKLQELLADYPLVVEEEDPDWPEDADGRGFNLDQFFNKITIKNVPKDDDDDDSHKEVVWQDDDYIKPVRDITAREWEDTVFKDFNPLIILVHNRYRRPRENEMARNELERAVKMFWETGLPSPRCVAIDACVEHELVEALQVSTFPEILFTKAGKILHRDKVVRSGEEWSKVMAFFYYKAVRPPCLGKSAAGLGQEKIPSL